LGNQPLLQAQLDNAELDKKTADALAAATAADVRSIGEIQTQLIDLEGRASIAEANVRHAAQSSSLALEQAKHDAAAATAAQEAAHQLAPLVQAVGAAAVAVAQAQVDAIPKGRSESKIALAQLDQAKASQQQATMDMTNKLAELQGQVDLADLHVRQAEGDLVHVPEPEDPTQFAPVQVEAHTAQAAVEAQLKFLAAAQAQHDADVLAAQARMASAEAAVIVAQTQLAMSEVRAPSAGTILALHAHPGEVAGPSGLLDLGDTADIFVDAVVDIHDAPGVKVGQKVSVKETAWSNDDVGGSVVEISPVVGGNSLPNPDPTAFSDTQVVVVKVHLDNPVPAANYINDQVYVVYSP
jgi:biotin carboxyl carrier protein